MLLVLWMPVRALAQGATPLPPATTAPVAGPTVQLSMDEAVRMALDTNLGLKSQRLSVNIADQNIISSRAAFLPLVTSSFSRNTASSPVQVNADGTVAVGSQQTESGSGQLSERLPWLGGGYSVSWTANRNTTGGGAASTFNPRLGSTVQFGYTQPLWQGLLIDQDRAALEQSTRQRVITDIALEQQIVQTEANVKSTYLGLVEAIEGRKVAQENMDLVEEELKDAKERVEVGQAPAIDIITADASVESAREQLIIADGSVSSAEDALRSQVLDPSRTDYWDVHLQPSDTIQVTPRTVDVDALAKNALANRLDLLSLKRNIEITNLNNALAKNLTHPSVNLTVGYVASGTGGTELLNGAASVRSFGTVLGDAFSGAYPSWTFGVNMSYPLGRTGAEAALAEGELQRQQQGLSQRQLELQIVAQVRQAARDVQTSFERVQATQAALTASEKQLDAEQRRFEVGQSDTFTLQGRESQLAAARVNALNATIAYNSALIELDRVQKIQ